MICPQANNQQTGERKTIYTGATAPLTSIALCPPLETLFVGCWDKNVYSVSFRTRQLVHSFKGHSDFVKCLLLPPKLSGKHVLLSGSADATIIVWDIESGRQLHKLKGHTKALQDLAIDPQSLPEQPGDDLNSFVLFSSSSDPEIRCWHISLESAYELPESLEKSILAHDTSVYRLRFDSEGDLWTASADKTAKHLIRSRDWEADTILQHPDFVRDVVVAEDVGLVVTACRDEEVRVWDIASGDLACTYNGHYEEVTGLAFLGHTVASVSIDGTVRKWSLERGEMARFTEEAKNATNGELPDDEVADKKGLLTAEEEAELAGLMDDED